MDSTSNSLKKKTIKGFFWRFAERMSSQLVTFGVSIILARLLGPSEYGVIALTMVFMAIANVLTIGGVGTSLIQKKNADELDFSTMFYAGLLLAVSVYVILFFVSPLIADIYNNSQVCPILRVLGLTLPISSVNSIQQAYVSRQLEFRKFFYATLIGGVLSGIVGISMAYFGYGVWALVGQQISNIVFNTITLSFIVDWCPRCMFSFERFKDLFGFGVKLMGANLVGTIFYELKIFLVGVKYKPADLGLFNRGESLPQMISNNINNTISTVMFPALSKMQDDKKAVKSALRRSMLTSSYILMPIMFFLCSVADKIVFILLGDEWLGCVPYMRVFCVSYSLGILSMTNLQSFNALGRSDITFKLEFIKKPILLLMVVGAMMISPIAIAISYVVYEFVAITVNAWPNKKLIDYKLAEQIKDISPHLLLSLIMAVVVYFVGLLKINVYVLFLFQAIVSLAFYYFVSKLFRLESYDYIFSLIKNMKNKNI